MDRKQQYTRPRSTAEPTQDQDKRQDSNAVRRSRQRSSTTREVPLNLLGPYLEFDTEPDIYDAHEAEEEARRYRETAAEEMRVFSAQVRRQRMPPGSEMRGIPIDGRTFVPGTRLSDFRRSVEASVFTGGLTNPAGRYTNLVRSQRPRRSDNEAQPPSSIDGPLQSTAGPARRQARTDEDETPSRTQQSSQAAHSRSTKHLETEGGVPTRITSRDESSRAQRLGERIHGRAPSPETIQREYARLAELASAPRPVESTRPRPGTAAAFEAAMERNVNPYADASQHHAPPGQYPTVDPYAQTTGDRSQHTVFPLARDPFLEQVRRANERLAREVQEQDIVNRDALTVRPRRRRRGLLSRSDDDERAETRSEIQRSHRFTLQGAFKAVKSMFARVQVDTETLQNRLIAYNTLHDGDISRNELVRVAPMVAGVGQDDGYDPRARGPAGDMIDSLGGDGVCSSELPEHSPPTTHTRQIPMFPQRPLPVQDLSNRRVRSLRGSSRSVDRQTEPLPFFLQPTVDPTHLPFVRGVDGQLYPAMRFPSFSTPEGSRAPRNSVAYESQAEGISPRNSYDAPYPRSRYRDNWATQAPKSPGSDEDTETEPEVEQGRCGEGRDTDAACDLFPASASDYESLWPDDPAVTEVEGILAPDPDEIGLPSSREPEATLSSLWSLFRSPSGTMSSSASAFLDALDAAADELMTTPGGFRRARVAQTRPLIKVQNEISCLNADRVGGDTAGTADTDIAADANDDLSEIRVDSPLQGALICSPLITPSESPCPRRNFDALPDPWYNGKEILTARDVSHGPDPSQLLFGPLFLRPTLLSCHHNARAYVPSKPPEDILATNQTPSVMTSTTIMEQQVEETYLAINTLGRYWPPRPSGSVEGTLRRIISGQPTLKERHKTLGGLREAGLYSLHARLVDAAQARDDNPMPKIATTEMQWAKESVLGPDSKGEAGSKVRLGDGDLKLADVLDPISPNVEPEVIHVAKGKGRASDFRSPSIRFQDPVVTESRPWKRDNNFSPTTQERAKRERPPCSLSSLFDHWQDSSSDSQVSPPSDDEDRLADDRFKPSMLDRGAGGVVNFSLKLNRAAPWKRATPTSLHQVSGPEGGDSLAIEEIDTGGDGASISTTSTSSSERRRTLDIKRSASGSTWGPGQGAKSSAGVRSDAASASQSPRKVSFADQLEQKRTPSLRLSDEDLAAVDEGGSVQNLSVAKDRLMSELDQWRQAAEKKGKSKNGGSSRKARSLDKVAAETKRVAERSPASRRTGLPPELMMTPSQEDVRVSKSRKDSRKKSEEGGDIKSSPASSQEPKVTQVSSPTKLPSKENARPAVQSVSEGRMSPSKTSPERGNADLESLSPTPTKTRGVQLRSPSKPTSNSPGRTDRGSLPLVPPRPMPKQRRDRSDAVSSPQKIGSCAIGLGSGKAEAGAEEDIGPPPESPRLKDNADDFDDVPESDDEMAPRTANLAKRRKFRLTKLLDRPPKAGAPTVVLQDAPRPPPKSILKSSTPAKHPALRKKEDEDEMTDDPIIKGWAGMTIDVSIGLEDLANEAIYPKLPKATRDPQCIEEAIKRTDEIIWQSSDRRRDMEDIEKYLTPSREGMKVLEEHLAGSDGEQYVITSPSGAKTMVTRQGQEVGGRLLAAAEEEKAQLERDKHARFINSFTDDDLVPSLQYDCPRIRNNSSSSVQTAYGPDEVVPTRNTE